MTFLLVVLPLALAIVLYVAQAGGYAFFLNRPGMALAFFGYALANAGFIYDALTVGVLK